MSNVIQELSICAQEHVAARRLDFLPYHFLLTSVGETGVLRYQVQWHPRGSHLFAHDRMFVGMHTLAGSGATQVDCCVVSDCMQPLLLLSEC